MLRRKLLLNLAPLIAAVLMTAIVAIWLLEKALGRLDPPDAASWSPEQQRELFVWFRRIVIGLAVVFVLLVNFSVGILLYVGSLIVKPIDTLVHATRELAEGRFDHRVDLSGRTDEFAELAAAFNGMAQRLQDSDRRQMETVEQVARAMNHEINNAIAIIELQLRLLARRTDPAEMEKPLTQIQQSLQRMTHAVRALGSIRRIALTEYLPGVKMLDLAQSQLPQEPAKRA